MTRKGKSLVHGFIAVVVSVLLGSLTLSMLMGVPAEARRYHRYAHFNYRSYAHPPYRRGYRTAISARVRPAASAAGIAAMAVDANTGRTLYATGQDELRHPASITKVMTLFLLFEQMHRGRLTLASPIAISAHAAEQPPTKIGLRPGATISVQNAIGAIVTESANDIAVAVAEAIAGSETAFAAIMTRKAHALGMTHTIYVNASGLPDDRQITTASDLIILGRAIQERFPREFGYFSTRNFVYGGRNHHNHNHLLGQIDGVDGIKTGYTRASGFNLLTSVRRNGRHVVAVVLGGRSAGGRDRVMASLIEDHIAEASAGGQSAPTIAENETNEPAAAAYPASEPPRAVLQVADAAPVPPQGIRASDLSSTAQAQPDPAVETASLADRPRPAFVSGTPRAAVGDQTGSIETRRRHIILDGSTGEQQIAQTIPFPDSQQASVRWAAGPSRHLRRGKHEVAQRDDPADPSSRREAARAKPDTHRLVDRAETPRASATDESPRYARTQVARDDPEAARKPHAGWVIQIGATDDIDKANDLLSRARSKDRSALASARPYTEKVRKGDQTLYRARFAVVEATQAEAACKSLKRQGFPCIAMKD